MHLWSRLVSRGGDLLPPCFLGELDLPTSLNLMDVGLYVGLLGIACRKRNSICFNYT